MAEGKGGCLGKHFYIVSKLNGLVLAQTGDESVQMTKRTEEQTKLQLWYQDEGTGTIRSKSCDLCLTFAPERRCMCISPYQPGNENQQWKLSADKIANRKKNDTVLDITGHKKDPGAKVCAWNWHGKANQKWEFEFTAPEYFTVRSRMHGKVLDVDHGRSEAGAKVVVHKHHGKDNQKWFENPAGYICSKLNGFTLDSSHGGQFSLQPLNPKSQSQGWLFGGGKIYNKFEPNKVADILKEKRGDGAEVGPWDYKGEDNQHWDKQAVK